jgi:hypothetical protein
MCFSHAEAPGAPSTRLNKSTVPAKRLVMNHQVSKANNSLSDVPSPSHFSPKRPFVPRGLGLLTGLSLYLVSPGVLGGLKFASNEDLDNQGAIQTLIPA